MKKDDRIVTSHSTAKILSTEEHKQLCSEGTFQKLSKYSAAFLQQFMTPLPTTETLIYGLFKEIHILIPISSTIINLYFITSYF